MSISISNKDLGCKISLAIPTFVEIIGVFVIADSIIDAGPPSKREATMYKSKIL